MNFSDVFWGDSEVEQIKICCEKAELQIYTVDNHRYIVECNDLVGITNLCMWEDVYIYGTSLTYISYEEIKTSSDSFIRNFYKAYTYADGSPCDDGRMLKGINILEIELCNNISFRVYCQNISVAEAEDQTKK